MLRLLIGIALMPTSALALAAAVRTIALLAGAPAAFPFLAGLGLSLAVWFLGRYGAAGGSGPWSLSGSLARRLYVFGHELTHALAAWSFGAKVLGFQVADSGGHVDLSRSNAFIALAPYCVPIYTLLVVLGYRILLALKPAAGGQGLFLSLMGLTLSFHMIKTFECLWDRRQPDLAAAGGVVFSLSAIALANALVVLALLKTLFPGVVALSGNLRWTLRLSWDFWGSAWRFLKPVQASFISQMRHE